jgi:hypothetical protein
MVVIQCACPFSPNRVLVEKMAMRKIWLVLFALAMSAGRAFAQDRDSVSKTATIVMARWGERVESNAVSTYHFVEVFQVRGKWIYPDIGYVDFGHSNYREAFAGGGYNLLNGKHITGAAELLYEQAAGPSTHNDRWLVPWTILQYRITPKLGGEASYFAYAPLSSTAIVQHILERAKFEYKIKIHWKIGVGYAGKKVENTSWQNKPFLTTTFITKGGNLEFWLQRLPQNKLQVQFRYKLIHLH